MATLMAFGALGIGISIDSVVQIAMFGISAPMITRLTVSLSLLAAVVAMTIMLLRRLGKKLDGIEERVSSKVWGELELK